MNKNLRRCRAGYLLPIYHETGHNPELVGPDSTSLFLRFGPAKKTWTKTGAIRSSKGNIQPAAVQLTDLNDGMTRRTPFTAARSYDQDCTWPIRRSICDGDRDFGYPSAFQARDSQIYVVFTSERRSVVNHAVFGEDWVTRGTVSQK
jgi:hypothetical protein